MDVSPGFDTANRNPLAAAVPWFAVFWIAGVWVFYLAHVVGWMRVYQLRRRGVCSASERWQREVVRLSERLRVSLPVRLLESSLTEVPVVLGHFRPVILMPVGLLVGLSTAEIEAILLHELAHLRRYDYAINLLQRFVEGLLYHPAAWWISRVIRAERENCCDDVVVAMTGNAHGYACALAALERNRQSGLQPALAATGGNLVKRIRRLLYPKSPAGPWTPVFAALVLIATAALTLQAWPVPQQDAAALPQTGLEAPYRKWLTQDVAYIISDAERAAFKGLTSDEEREKFIEQFWLRRDPTPGTLENEARVEHYRRIAFTNNKFTTPSGLPGWKTDRGRIYITYGPPDEMESHPQGGAQTRDPYEVWMYRYLEGIGNRVFVTFVTGDYRLASNVR